MDIQRTKELIELVASERIEELVISEGTSITRIVRSIGAASISHSYSKGPQNERAQTLASEQVHGDEGQADKAEVASASLSTAHHPVVAPMAGTFYRSSGRDATPFVEIGTSVVAGMTVCVIEAMKIMNDVESDRDGQIVSVLCEDGEAVERGQTLFIIQ